MKFYVIFVLCLSLEACYSELSSVELIDVTESCCGHGQTYAMRGSCAGAAPPEDIDEEQMEPCLAALNSCCEDQLREKEECARGIKLAESRLCDSASSDIGKTCCNECNFGQLSGQSQGALGCGEPTEDFFSPTSALRKNAFYQCCMKAAEELEPTTEATTPKPKLPCNSMRCQHSCTEQGGRGRCECREGFRLQPDNTTCKDINECAEAVDDLCLAEDTVCHNTEGSFKCVPLKKREVGLGCPAGFKRNVVNQVCDDIDECQLPRPPCPKYLCENTIGGYKCAGKPGKPFVEEAPGVTTEAVVTPVVRNDICPPGFRAGDDEECLDIDECAERLDDCQPLSQHCINTHGSYFCQDHVSKRCAPGFKVNSATGVCEDIDECVESLEVCKRSEVCINLPGAYNCKSKISTLPKLATKKCQEGTRLRPGGTTCEDIDECREGTHLCDQFQNCINTFGGHECRCKNGFEWDSSSRACVDIDECALKLDNCQRGQSCLNVLGSFTCTRVSTTTPPPEYEYEYYDTDDENETESQPTPQTTPATTTSSTTTSTTSTTTTTTTPRPTTVPTTIGTTPRPQPPRRYPYYPRTTPRSRNTEARRPYYPRPTTTSTTSTTEPPPEEPEIPDDTNPFPPEIPSSPDTRPERPENRLPPNAPENRRPYEPPSYTPDSRPDDRPENRLPPNIPDSRRPYQPPYPDRPSDRIPATPKPDNDPDRPNERNPDATSPNNRRPDERNPETYRPNRPYRPDNRRPYRPNPDTAVTETTTLQPRRPGRPYFYPRRPTTPVEVNVPMPTDVNTVEREREPDGSFDIDTSDIPKDKWTNVIPRDPVQPDFDPNLVTCMSGFERSPRGECVDINECDEGTHICSSLEVCKNRPGGYECECVSGFFRADSGWCVPITTSSTTTTARTTSTSTTTPKPTTTSTAVYTYSTEITTASTTPDWNYSPHSPWRPTPTCNQGFSYSSTLGRCIDIDECATHRANCLPTEDCVNTEGGYTCECGRRCRGESTPTYVTPSREPEPVPETNVITVGSQYGRRGTRYMRPTYTRLQDSGAVVATCPWGYKLTPEKYCHDVDECERNVSECGPEQTCENFYGGYSCQCPAGHRLVNKRCEDIDECKFGTPCSYNSRCINTVGSYRCECGQGFRNAPTNDKVCVDVDECAEASAPCEQSCANAWGSYRCYCNRGYRLRSDNRTCEDIDECAEWGSSRTRGRLCGGRCVNTAGSYRCACPAGYRLADDERSCIDIDECETGVAQCGNEAGSVCQNTRGGFHCHHIRCPVGYRLEGKHKCSRIQRSCLVSDFNCLQQPSTYSYNFITFVSNIYLPTGSVDLFTMHGPSWRDSVVSFEIRMIDVQASPGVKPTDLSCFDMRPRGNICVVSLLCSLPGPQVAELELTMSLYQRAMFAGSAVARLVVIVSEYEF